MYKGKTWSGFAGIGVCTLGLNMVILGSDMVCHMHDLLCDYQFEGIGITSSSSVAVMVPQNVTIVTMSS